MTAKFQGWAQGGMAPTPRCWGAPTHSSCALCLAAAGENESKVNAPHVVDLLEAAGAAAVTIHGRTMVQRWVGAVGSGGGTGGRGAHAA